MTSFRALTQLGALECVQLTDMFFGRDPGKLVDDISMKVMYFDTLFMNIEVNTFGGQVNGQIDANEFWEGACPAPPARAASLAPAVRTPDASSARVRGRTHQD